jgi:hypothetical protein
VDDFELSGGEVQGLLFNVADISMALLRIEKLLIEEDDDEEADEG